MNYKLGDIIILFVLSSLTINGFSQNGSPVRPQFTWEKLENAFYTEFSSSRGSREGVYKGMSLKGKAHGPGRFIVNKNETFYAGFYKNGKRHGHGIEVNFITKKCTYKYYENNIIKASKSIEFSTKVRKDGLYVGQMKNREPHGVGVIVGLDGDLYLGSFADDRKNGFGVHFLEQEEYIKNAYYSNGEIANNYKLRINSLTCINPSEVRSDDIFFEYKVYVISERGEATLVGSDELVGQNVKNGNIIESLSFLPIDIKLKPKNMVKIDFLMIEIDNYEKFIQALEKGNDAIQPVLTVLSGACKGFVACKILKIVKHALNGVERVGKFVVKFDKDEILGKKSFSFDAKTLALESFRAAEIPLPWDIQGRDKGNSYHYKLDGSILFLD